MLFSAKHQIFCLPWCECEVMLLSLHSIYHYMLIETQKALVALMEQSNQLLIEKKKKKTNKDYVYGRAQR